MSTRVLIVDDDATARRQIAHHVEAEGYEVLQAAGAAEAIGLIPECEPAIIVADWAMPEMDGLDLCRHVRSHADRSLYVIVLAAAADRDRLDEALAAGADDCLAKPFDASDLLARLRIGERIVTLERTLACTKGTVDELIDAVDATGGPPGASSTSNATNATNKTSASNGTASPSRRPVEDGHRRQ